MLTSLALSLSLPWIGIGLALQATSPRAKSGLGDLLQPIASAHHRSGSFAPPAPPSAGDVQVSSSSPNAQYEPAIAIDPTDRSHLVAAATDARTSPPKSAFYASFDEGQTWSETFFDDSFTPNVAFGADGSLYLAAVRNTGTPPRNASYDLFFGRSYDGGRTTADWHEVTSNNGDNVFAYVPNVLVDTTSGRFGGRLYLVYTVGSSGFVFAVAGYSDDFGLSWNFVTVGDHLSENVYTTAAIDSRGVVCVTYYEYGGNGVYFDSSSNGGATFGTDVLIATIGAGGFVSPPAIAVDTSGGPFQDRIYVTWAQQGANDADVVFASSSDHGATWSTPILASDVATNDQLTPALAVDPNGTVNFSFFDARDDPADRRVFRYVSRSTDGGATILPNVRVSTQSFDPAPGTYTSGAPLRAGIAASDRSVHPIWADDRSQNDDIFTASVNLDLFTDVPAIPAATGGTATFTLDAGPLFPSAEYHLLGSASGTSPGTDFQHVNVPLNFDVLMLATIVVPNSGPFANFAGTLDASGLAGATLSSGPLPPSLVGIQLDFAFLTRVGNAVRWSSAPSHLTIVP